MLSVVYFSCNQQPGLWQVAEFSSPPNCFGPTFSLTDGSWYLEAIGTSDMLRSAVLSSLRKGER